MSSSLSSSVARYKLNNKLKCDDLAINHLSAGSRVSKKRRYDEVEWFSNTTQVSSDTKNSPKTEEVIEKITLKAKRLKL